MPTYPGTIGDDSFSGGGAGDVFDLFQGGSDTVDGRGGDDRFNLGAAFAAGDRIDGALGYDTLYLDGDYPALTITPDMLVAVEEIDLAAGGAYDITLADGVAPQGSTLTFIAHGPVVVDASAEADTRIYLSAGPGGFDFTGGGGGDSVTLTAAMGVGDRFAGGAGDDELGIATGGLYRFSDGALTGVETIVVAATEVVAIVLADGNLAPGAGMSVVNLGSAALRVDGRYEKDAGLTLVGAGLYGDTLIGGKGADTLVGRGGEDLMVGGKGADLIDFGDFSGGDATTFIRSRKESPIGAGDTIQAASDGDVIDLSRIDADKFTPGNQAFALVEAFSGAAGEAVISYDASTGRTTLLLETNGKGAPEMEITLRADPSGEFHDYTDFAGFVL